VDGRYDIVIAGGGPAGALTARLLGLRRSGARILVLDAEAQPRHRPCGEYLSPGGLAVIHRAGLLDAVRASGAAHVRSVALAGSGGGWRAAFAPVLGRRPFCDHGLGVRRERLDRVLQDGAAEVAELRRGHRVADLARDGGRWSVAIRGPAGAYRVEASLLIGADGRGSVVRRRGGLDRPAGFRRVALVARAHGIAHGDRVEMHLGPLGQIGLCPLGEGEVNLNLLLAPPSAILLRRMDRTRLLRAALAATPTLALRCRAAVLGPVLASGSLPQRASATVGDGLCLVGDAAGFSDPFTGEGMTIAARGAGLLADALAEVGLDRMPAAGALAAYGRAFHAAIGRRRAIAEGIQGLLARRRGADAVAALTGRIPLLARLLVAEASGFAPGTPAAAGRPQPG
jgi:2-polyprenyl-6-methoxyphenol hydroxylase-like FAD-dependent oxidoreductase